jgi:PadR family transcriptional regulator, regulatory protein PadR
LFGTESLLNVLENTHMLRLPVLKGTLDLLVLRALNWTPMHGFEIVTWLERAGGGALDLEDSALYQAVYRLEARGYLEAEWGVTENNRRARYYKITSGGRAYLRAETKNWMQYANTVTSILSAAKDGQPARVGA